MTKRWRGHDGVWARIVVRGICNDKKTACQHHFCNHPIRLTMSQGALRPQELCDGLPVRKDVSAVFHHRSAAIVNNLRVGLDCCAVFHSFN